MSGLVYTASIEQIAVSAIQDLFEITAPADAVVELLAVRVGQDTEEGDAAAEMLPIQITRYSTGGSGGATLTSRPHHVGGPAAGSTVDRNNTTQGGTPVVVLSDAFNVQAGWLYQPIPEERIYVSPSDILAIELPVAPADAMTVSASITFKELGG